MVEMDKVCRSCMCEVSDMRNVFETVAAIDGHFQIAEMLMACASVEVSKFSIVNFVCAEHYCYILERSSIFSTRAEVISKL